MQTGIPRLGETCYAARHSVVRGFQLRTGRDFLRLVAIAVALVSVSCGDRRAATHALPDDTSPIALSGQALGPVDDATPFDVATLAALFPTATLTTTTASSEGETHPVLRIDMGGNAAFDVHSVDGATIHSVEILDGHAVANLGVVHGTRFAAVFPASPAPACIAGLEEMSGTVLCQAPVSPDILLVFAGDWDGPDGTVPPAATLASWQVERIFWRPGFATSARNGGN